MKLIIFLGILVIAFAHSTTYGVPPNPACKHPSPAPIKSYHIHILFW